MRFENLTGMQKIMGLEDAYEFKNVFALFVIAATITLLLYCTLGLESCYIYPLNFLDR